MLSKYIRILIYQNKIKMFCKDIEKFFDVLDDKSKNFSQTMFKEIIYKNFIKIQNYFKVF